MAVVPPIKFIQGRILMLSGESKEAVRMPVCGCRVSIEHVGRGMCQELRQPTSVIGF